MLGAELLLKDRLPLELLPDLKNLNASWDTLFRAVFLFNLSSNVRASLYLLSSKSTKDLAALVNRIMDMSRLSLRTEVNAGADVVSSPSWKEEAPPLEETD